MFSSENFQQSQRNNSVAKLSRFSRYKYYKRNICREEWNVDPRQELHFKMRKKYNFSGGEGGGVGM